MNLSENCGLQSLSVFGAVPVWIDCLSSSYCECSFATFCPSIFGKASILSLTHKVGFIALSIRIYIPVKVVGFIFDR